MPDLTPPELGYMWIRSFDPDFFFEAELYGDAPLPTPDSYSGWTVIQVPERLGLTEWAGRNPMGIDLDFIIDALNEPAGAGPGLHTRRDTLEKMAATASRSEAPPICIFDTGGLCPHDFSRARHVRWVIEGFDWDRSQTINSDSGNPLRIVGTIHLRQYNHDTVLDTYNGPADKNKQKKKGKQKKKPGGKNAPFGVVRQGGSLMTVAADVYGDSSRWRELADANGIRDPRAVVAGQVIRVP